MNKNYKFIGTVDVKKIKNKLFCIDECVWDEFGERQDTFEVHRDTKSIPILWNLQSLETLNVSNKTKYYDIFNKEYELINIENYIKKYYGNGKILRILFTRLKSNSIISPHVDSGKSLELSNRIHIPIITNENVVFIVNGEQKNMVEGEIWEIDNQKLHSVLNNSNYDRIHLIIDYLKDNIL
jgi:hypothetical protein